MNTPKNREGFHRKSIIQGLAALLIASFVSTAQEKPAQPTQVGPAATQSTTPGPGAESDLGAKRRKALGLLNQGQFLAALPLCDDLARALPEDAIVQACLAYCLFGKSSGNVTAEEALELRKRGREAGLRARKLGDTSQTLNQLISAPEDPVAARQSSLSPNPEADKKMKEGQDAFGRGDYDAALDAYSAALKLDSTLYAAALDAGDMCFRKKDIVCASEWFPRAIAIKPEVETAYRYWGDTLMSVGRTAEARDKYIESLIASPTQRPWGALANWARRNNYKIAPPKIDRPLLLDVTPNVYTSNGLLDKASGRSAWLGYSVIRSAWRKTVFSENYPNEKQYRHTLAEEAAALNNVVDSIDYSQVTQLDPQLASLAQMKKDNVLEAWILLSGADAGIARDYPAYRSAHHDQLRTYIEKYVLQVDY